MFRSMIITPCVYYDLRTQTRITKEEFPIKSRCETTIGARIMEPHSMFARYLIDDIRSIAEMYGGDVDISPQYKIFEDRYLVAFVAIHNIPGNDFRKWYNVNDWLGNYKEYEFRRPEPNK